MSFVSENIGTLAEHARAPLKSRAECGVSFRVLLMGEVARPPFAAKPGGHDKMLKVARAPLKNWGRPLSALRL